MIKNVSSIKPRDFFPAINKLDPKQRAAVCHAVKKEGYFLTGENILRGLYHVKGKEAGQLIYEFLQTEKMRSMPEKEKLSNLADFTTALSFLEKNNYTPKWIFECEGAVLSALFSTKLAQGICNYITVKGYNEFEVGGLVAEIENHWILANRLVAEIAKAGDYNDSQVGILVDEAAKAMGYNESKTGSLIAEIAKAIDYNDSQIINLIDITARVNSYNDSQLGILIAGIANNRDCSASQVVGLVAEIAKARGYNDSQLGILINEIAKSTHYHYNKRNIFEPYHAYHLSTLIDITARVKSYNDSQLGILIAIIARAMGYDESKTGILIDEIAKARGYNDSQLGILMEEVTKSMDRDKHRKHRIAVVFDQIARIRGYNAIQTAIITGAFLKARGCNIKEAGSLAAEIAENRGYYTRPVRCPSPGHSTEESVEGLGPLQTGDFVSEVAEVMGYNENQTNIFANEIIEAMHFYREGDEDHFAANIFATIKNRREKDINKTKSYLEGLMGQDWNRVL